MSFVLRRAPSILTLVKWIWLSRVQQVVTRVADCVELLAGLALPDRPQIVIDILIWSQCPRQGAIFVLIVVSTYYFFEALFVAIFETRL